MTEASTKRSPALDLAASEVLHTVILLHWISQARHLIRQVQLLAQVRPEFKRLLEQDDIRYGLSWDSQEEEAASGLFYDLRDRIEAMPDAGGA